MPGSRAGGCNSTVVPHAQGRSRADHLANRAFELYERRSSMDGWDLDDDSEPDPGPVQERRPHVAI
jgi:hypothetical protein